ncbi:MAG: formylglycine-generating enzyme family protein [Lysobacteraceae bacterium]
MNRVALLIALLPVVAHAGGDYVSIPAGQYRSVLNYEDTKGNNTVARFELMKTPVTNAEFLAFVQSHPQWRRDEVPGVYAEKAGYLAHWQAPLELGDAAKPEQPVTHVSWFAASAYCEAQHARLPMWAEWEYVAAADTTRRDARSDPVWRESILGWYSKPSTSPLTNVGQSPPNVYGVQDLHGLIWEWTEDFASMLVSSDDRSQSDSNRLKFCGATALTTQDRENYAVLMRVAMLSSLEAVNSTSSLGFRCARSLPDPESPPKELP